VGFSVKKGRPMMGQNRIGHSINSETTASSSGGKGRTNFGRLLVPATSLKDPEEEMRDGREGFSHNKGTALN